MADRRLVGTLAQVMAIASALSLAAAPAWAETDERIGAAPGSAYEADGFRVAGMIGQVNGRPIYAHQVLRPMHEELAALGQRLGRDGFRRRAEPMIHERLAEIVQNALILAEAERDLSDRERQGLSVIMQRVREDKLRRYGRGSRAVADRVLRERTGQGLERTLEDRRQQLLVERYMQRTVWPRVNVARRDVERYYHDNHGEFNPPPTRTLRVIRADAQAAESVRERLEAGEPFAEVAGDRQLNAYRPGDGGLMADAPGDEVFGHEPVNEAMRELDEGEHAGPIDVGDEMWFIYIEQIDRPEARPLKEVQREIEQRLRMQQLNELSSTYYQELLERGSYNPLEQMAGRLVEIAVNRYAPARD